MAKSKLVEDTEVLVANIFDPIEPEPEPDRQLNWSELSRFQLTGEYPEWYTPPKPVDVQPTDKA